MKTKHLVAYYFNYVQLSIEGGWIHHASFIPTNISIYMSFYMSFYISIYMLIYNCLVTYKSKCYNRGNVVKTWET